MTFGSFIGFGASALTTLLFAGIAYATRRSAIAPVPYDRMSSKGNGGKRS